MRIYIDTSVVGGVFDDEFRKASESRGLSAYSSGDILQSRRSR